MDESKVSNYCESKFKINEKIFDKEVLNNRTKYIESHALEYNLNIKQVRETYKNNFFEIDCN